jgi:hypothetical protein
MTTHRPADIAAFDDSIVEFTITETGFGNHPLPARRRRQRPHHPDRRNARHHRHHPICPLSTRIRGAA